MLQILKDVALVGAIMLYLVPSIEADTRERDDASAITLVNVLLGWTVIGWFAALSWARRPVSESQLAHVTAGARRAIARATIARIVARAGNRSALPHRPVGDRSAVPGACR